MPAHTRAAVTLLLLSLPMTAADAADLRAPSRIDAVTVFPSGAEVTRLLKVRIPAGEHTVVVDDLPVGAVGNSIRVEGRGSGQLLIGSVDSRRGFTTRAEQETTAAERKRLEREIEKVSDERAALEAAIEAANAQKKLFEGLAELPSKPVPVGAQPPAPTDWGALGQLIGDRTLAIQRSILDTQHKIREVDRRIEDLNKALAALAPAQEERTEVKVSVSAPAALEADLTIKYQIGNAAWTPIYEARLSTGSRTEAPKLRLIRRASIQQRTGEAWENVALSLSTTRPAQGSQAPDLQPLLVDAVDPPPPRPLPAPRAAAEMVGSAAPPPPAAAMMRSAPVTMAADSAPKVAEEVRATIEGNAFQALYGITGRQTVTGNGEAKRVQIDATDLDPTLTVRTVPKRDPKAFLYAKLTTPRTTAILAGLVALFRDNTYVGNARFPQLAPGEDHEFGFGQDDNVVVKYAVTDEKRGETGIISTSKTEAKSFKITLKSLHQRPMSVRVVDQFPVALSQDMKVDITSRVPPTARDVDDKRGVVHWDFTMAPDEERMLDFGYRLTWPAAKQLQVR
jgi:uncharacterized protein (TIGR02231 family)